MKAQRQNHRIKVIDPHPVNIHVCTGRLDVKGNLATDGFGQLNASKVKNGFPVSCYVNLSHLFDSIRREPNRIAPLRHRDQHVLRDFLYDALSHFNPSAHKGFLVAQIQIAVARFHDNAENITAGSLHGEHVLADNLV